MDLIDLSISCVAMRPDPTAHVKVAIRIVGQASAPQSSPETG
jgi:hypothetical protein